MLAWLLAAAGLGIGWLTQARYPLRTQPPAVHWSWAGMGATILATILWWIASLAGLPALGATLALVIWAWLLVGVDYIPNRLGLSVHALIVLCIASIKWILWDTLEHRLASDWNALEYLPVLNPRLGMAALLAASLGAVLWLRKPNRERALTESGHGSSSETFWAVAIFGPAFSLLTIGLSFEVDRLVERGVAVGHDIVWPMGQLKLFGLTLLWLTAAWVLAVARRRLELPAIVPGILMLAVAGKFLLIDMLLARFAIAEGPAPVLVLLNFQMFTAVVVVASLLSLRYLARPNSTDGTVIRHLRWSMLLLSLLIVLAAGSLEIDRAFASSLAAGLSDPGLAKQVAMSIFWSVFAIATVTAGFRFRADWLRFFALVCSAFRFSKSACWT